MLLDNENKNIKVYEWIKKYTEEGNLNIVTGYFTVGALAFLSREINDKIRSYRFILGDIVNYDAVKDRTLDLLNENITIEAAFKLSAVAQEAVEFLKQNKVEAKTLEPNFCHAKAYMFDPASHDDRNHYFIAGSSNLTEAGLGLKVTNNIELNIAETGNNNQYKEIAEWFESLWNKKEAHKNKTLINENGNKYTKPFKEYLIEEIEKIFIEYTPKQLYYKVLFELFGNQIILDHDNPEFNRQVGRLENTVVYNTLYDFQKKGVLSLIKMLQKYDGAILADAVGLGKTWTALAVMKFFQLQGREVILICPKKLQHNWNRYLRNQESRFEKDQFDFFIRFHTDMHQDRMESYLDRADKLFRNDKPKLFVIDESHNLRNSKSQRYNFFIDEILGKNSDAKVLMLSATPINNSLIDIRNQFKLIKKGNSNGFYEDLGIKNIDYTFRTAQQAFNEWKEEERPRINDFIKMLPAQFFKLTDSLIVARTRQMIQNQNTGLHFPLKVKPENIFVTPKQIGNVESFDELLNHFPPFLSGYQPSFYIEQEDDVDKLHDEKQRDRFLAKMLYILLIKRLESSWYSFHLTVEKILKHHENALNLIKAYQNNLNDSEIDGSDNQELFKDDELEDIAEEFTLGKKRKINLSEIDKAGNLDYFKKDLKKDIDALDLLNRNLIRFKEQLEKETNIPNNQKSCDDKLESLIQKINVKRKSGINHNNQKVIIFTVYRDTAMYLFEQLTYRGFNKVAVVSGDSSKTDTSISETKNFEPILERFAPFTKLYNEKEWTFTPSSVKLSDRGKYKEWVSWIADNDKKTYEKLQRPIDILIATDALSEGQNLQDCDMVINYDIHWNPVRVIQRMGRIDRLGSPNNKIFGINYWPSVNINDYLNLQGRIEQRMAMMKLAGSEVDMKFSDTFAEMATDKEFEDKLNERMLKQMQTSWDDIQDNQQGLGFDNLTLEGFRQDLLEELQKNEKLYKQMPKGVFTGFIAEKEICSTNGIIALLGYPAKPAKVLEHQYQNYDLVYIDMHGREVLLNQKEVLDALAFHKDKSRFVPDSVEKGEEEAILQLSNSINIWLNNQAVEEEKQENGTVKKRMGSEVKDLLSKIKVGDSLAKQRIKQNIVVTDKYKPENFDLITWFLVSQGGE
jgi:superfamily II DNA or RNA helicase